MKTRCRFLCFSYNSSEEIKYDFRFFSFLSQALQSYPFKAFSLCVIPCSQKQQHEVTSIWERSCLLRTQTQRVELRRPLCTQTLGNAVLTCVNVSQTSPYFSSPVLTEKQKGKQPDVHTHTHTRRKLGNADDKFNLRSWPNLGLSPVHHHLTAPLPGPRASPTPWLCNMDANELPQLPGDRQENGWLPSRRG